MVYFISPTWMETAILDFVPLCETAWIAFFFYKFVLNKVFFFCIKLFNLKSALYLFYKIKYILLNTYIFFVILRLQFKHYTYIFLYLIIIKNKTGVSPYKKSNKNFFKKIIRKTYLNCVLQLQFIFIILIHS